MRKAIIFGLFLLMVPVFSHATKVVFAPHPDDEALMASGIIESARLAGEPVKVVVVTNGDANGVVVAHLRELETVAAMRDVIGIADDDIIFLGYPDTGLRDIYYYYTSPGSVYMSPMGTSETYAYEGLGNTDYHTFTFGSPAPYNNPSLMQDIVSILRRYHPENVFVTSINDEHSDHAALYYFVVEAILSVMREDFSFQPTLHEGIVHPPCEGCDPDYRWPESFAPDQSIPEPPYLFTTPLSWTERESIAVPSSMLNTDIDLNKKSVALTQYQTQVDPWWFGFVKRDEVFWKRELYKNLALRATVTASIPPTFEMTGPEKVIDGFISGYPFKDDGEWVADDYLEGVWVQLNWTSPQQIQRIILYDRPSADENILNGTLSFSDGSTFPVGELPGNGSGLVIDFPLRTVTWARFAVNHAVGTSTGLAEYEVYGLLSPQPNNTFPSILSGPSVNPADILDIQTSDLSVTAVDADGDLLTYSWSATGGSILGAGPTAVYTPPRVTQTTVYRIEVTVGDGRGGSATGSVNVTVRPTGMVNVALNATATASSENISRGQDASKAIDGVVSGYPVDSTREWCSVRQLAGAWITLRWGTPQTISRIILNDRINTTDQVRAGTLEFSDGSSLAVGALPNDGTGYAIDFPVKVVTSITLRITSARGENTGLAEFQVYSSVAEPPNILPAITSGPTADPTEITT